MITFTADIKNTYKDIFFYLVPIIIITAANFFLTESSLSSVIIFISLFMIFFLFRIIDREKVNMIIFDDQTQIISFEFSRFFRKKRIQSLSFKEVTVEVDRKSTFAFLADAVTISFIKDEIVFFDINKDKDGFHQKELEKIITTAKQFSLAVIEK